jgi:glycosyltransferase involved in cell wall biosynthesis
LLLFVNNWIQFFLSHRWPLALAARELGFAVHVAAPDGEGRDRIERERFPFHELRMHRSSKGPRSELAAIAELVRLYRRLRPAIVHHVAVKAIVYGSTAARLTGVPAVINAFTGLGWLFSPAPLARATRWALKVPMRLALAHPGATTILQNVDDQELLSASGLVPRERICIIPGSGADPATFTPVPEREGRPLVVLPARLLWSKGVGEFVEAARLLRADGVDARFALVGDLDPDNPTAVPREKVESWQSEGVIDWWGRRTDMPAVFAQSHVVCLPSHREGMPKALIEAAACGRAIVATDVPGCRAVARHEVNALLTPPGQPIALARALRRVIEDRALRSTLGQRGRELFLRELTLDRVVGQTLDLYRASLARR